MIMTMDKPTAIDSSSAVDPETPNGTAPPPPSEDTIEGEKDNGDKETADLTSTTTKHAPRKRRGSRRKAKKLALNSFPTSRQDKLRPELYVARNSTRPHSGVDSHATSRPPARKKRPTSRKRISSAPSLRKPITDADAEADVEIAPISSNSASLPPHQVTFTKRYELNRVHSSPSTSSVQKLNFTIENDRGSITKLSVVNPRSNAASLTTSTSSLVNIGNSRVTPSGQGTASSTFNSAEPQKAGELKYSHRSPLELSNTVQKLRFTSNGNDLNSPASSESNESSNSNRSAITTSSASSSRLSASQRPSSSSDRLRSMLTLSSTQPAAKKYPICVSELLTKNGIFNPTEYITRGTVNGVKQDLNGPDLVIDNKILSKNEVNLKPILKNQPVDQDSSNAQKEKKCVRFSVPDSD